MEKDQGDIWKGVYYPEEFINNKRTRALLCLLFDKIICHFPVADTACGGGHGMSEDLFGDNLLVKAGIIELEEEILLSKVDELVDDWPMEGGWPRNFNRYVKLQVAGMAVMKCKDRSFVPVTDKQDFRVPALILNEFDTTSNAKLQAIAAAVESIEMVMPPIIEMEDEDILMLREELANDLIPFRRAMLGLAPQIRKYLNEGASIPDVYREAKYVIDTSVNPILAECRARIEREKRAFWRKILLRAGGILPKFIMNWTEKSIVSAGVDAVKDLSELGVLAINNESLLENMKSQGGFGFLLNLEERLKP
ncbi:MAG: hypothetical protein ACYTDW_07395 [Planctomycetota bacterium]|jgi:hypothetical protein